MAYTGYLIIQYIDENPNSPTYGETWTERQLDTTHCPADGGGEWELISTFCESDTSGYTGNRINTYYNSVTDEYSSTTTPDASCSASTFDELWVNSGDVYCEITEEGVYTGWGIQLQVQRNSNLLNYGETREIRVANASCSAHTEPIWQTLSTNCHIVTDELTCYLTYDGTADLLQIDNNPSSPTFNQTRTITGESEECQCEACDRIEYEWRFVDDICGIQMPINYGLTGLTDDTVYHVYRQYGTCIIDGQSGRTKPTNVYSAVTYQTGVTGCTYRWVDTEETVCALNGDEIDLNNQWSASTSYGSLSGESENYDFYESYGNYHVKNGIAEMFITISSVTSFTLKVRNYSESDYDYVQVLNLDDTSSITSWKRNTSAGTGTYANGYVKYTNRGLSSNSTWHDVTFDNLDGGMHIIRVLYGKDSSQDSNDDRGYVAIPKSQTPQE